jgi:H+/Cl- antiporter ClcA
VSAGDAAAWAVAVVSILGGMASYTQFMIKHYFKELKPNGGSSMKDQVNRLEARVDTIIDMLGK